MRNSLQQTPEKPKSFADVLTGWLQDLARTHSRGRRDAIVLTKQDFALYADAFKHLSPQQLDGAFLRCLQTCRFFPTPADVLDHIEKAGDKALQIEADDAWQRALKFAQLGIFSKVKELDARTEHAVRAAGGLAWIESCPDSELQWAKKRFVDDFLLTHDLDRDQHLLPEGKTRALLAELRRRGEGELLLTPAKLESEPGDSR